MKRFAFFSGIMIFQLFSLTLHAQPSAKTGLHRPKLIVGIVVDQMRWDYLYRYYDLYKADGGFKRFLNEGFSCENTFIPYTPTVTAAGHTCIYTGSVPAIHGIVGNEWYDREQQKEIYCAEDKSVVNVGSNTPMVGEMSPRNLLTTTITDELRLATNFKGKVIGVAIKDRGAILPAGHAANGAYWYDGKTGNFITSSYYMNQLPPWVVSFNKRKIVDSLYALNWNLFLSANIYPQYSSEDAEVYESKPLGTDQLQFPYNLSKFIGSDYGRIASTPYGNTLTLEMAKAALAGEGLGKSGSTDFLAISISTPDYIGHSFGPNSWEQLDDYVRLDDALGKFFSYLDQTVGKGQYLVFLSADHGVTQIPGYMNEHKLPGGTFSETTMMDSLNQSLKQKFDCDSIIVSTDNYQLYLNHPALAAKNIDEQKVKAFIIDYLWANSAVSQVIDLADLSATTLDSREKDMCANGFYKKRSGDIQLILKPGYFPGSSTGTSHGSWNPYDAHIPLLFYGWEIKHGSTNQETYMTDIAPTIAAMLHIQMPSGCIGKVISEVMQ